MSDAAIDRLDEVDHRAARAGAPGGDDDSAIDHVAARLTRRANGWIAIGLTLLLGVCATVAYLVGQNEKTAAEIYTLSGLRVTASRVRELALDAETGQRGYLVTHNDAYLQPYAAASRSLRQTLDALLDHATDDPTKAAIVHRLAVVLDARFDELQQAIDLERAGRHDEALAIVNSDGGKRHMDEIRELGERLDVNLRDLLSAAAAHEARTREYMLGALAVAALGIIGVSAMMIRETRWQLRRLNAARSRLRTMVGSLEGRVARRTRELTEINQRFDIALEASGIVVFTQDRHLKYTWVSRGLPEFPIEHVIGKSDDEVLSPRSSVVIERLKRRVLETGQPARGEVSVELGGAPRWWNLTIVPALAADGSVDGLLCGAVDISARKETEAQVRLLLNEVTHRSKNLLSVIQAIMRQTAAHSATPRDFTDRFTARLQSLAASHDLLVAEKWQGAGLHDLVRSQLGPYSDRVGAEIQIEGPPVLVPPLAAQHIGMAMHELATNAAKYGALSVPEGRVRVTWQVAADTDGGRICDLSWSESGGPPVTRPSRSGFGRVVIERTVARALNGNVTLDYAPGGLRWALTFRMPS